MTIKVYSLQCPACGASLFLDPDVAEQSFDDFVGAHYGHLAEDQYIIVFEHLVGDGVIN